MDAVYVQITLKFHPQCGFKGTSSVNINFLFFDKLNVDHIVFVPIKVVRRRNLWARLDIERKFLNDNNLPDDGLNINL